MEVHTLFKSSNFICISHFRCHYYNEKNIFLISCSNIFLSVSLKENISTEASRLH